MNDNISEIRKNVINWYPFKENSSVLQIGIEETQITEEISSKVGEVVTIEPENLEKLKTKQKFDYIVLAGTLQMYNMEEKAYKKLLNLLSRIKNNLKEDGKILLAIDNKYGMKYWTSVYADKNILCNNKHALSKTMIEDILDKVGLVHRKYYYLLPDYKLTNAIFTDKYLPTTNSISRNFTYAEDEFVSFNQTEAYQEILKENKELFKFFATSYFIEIAENEFEDNQIKFVSFTNIRKEQYRIKTVMYEDKVTKEAVNEKAKQHIEQIKNNIDIMKNIGINTLDSYDGNTIISKYIKDEKSYDEILLEYLENEEEDKFFEEIKKYKENLADVLKKVEIKDINTVFDKYNINCEETILNKLTFVEHGLWDLIFQNTFYIDSKLYFYDQEWYEENIPVEYIIYRAIAYFGEAHNYIPREILLEKLNLQEFLSLFEELDNKIQENIRDEEMWNSHCSIKTGQTLVHLYQNLQSEFEQYKELVGNIKGKEEKIAKAGERIREIEDKAIELERKYKEVLEQQEKIYNSTSWKITKPVRFLGKYLK